MFYSDSSSVPSLIHSNGSMSGASGSLCLPGRRGKQAASDTQVTLFYVHFHVITFLMRKDASWLQHRRCLSFTVQNSTFALRQHKRMISLAAVLTRMTVLQLVQKSVTISGLCMGVLETWTCCENGQCFKLLNLCFTIYFFTPILDKFRWRCRVI